MTSSNRFNFNGLFALLHRGMELDKLSVDSLSNEAAHRIRRLQIRGAIDQMRTFVVGNTLFAPVLSFQVWGQGFDLIVISWTILMLSFSWWLFFRWRESYESDGSEADMRRFVAETCVNAGLWCLAFVLFYPLAQGDQKTIIITVMTGSLALGTVGFSQAPRAAFWYLAIQTSTLSLVPLFYGWFWSSPADLMIGALALLAGFAIFDAVLERARAQMTAFGHHEDLVRKSEIVDLLLKDYEEQGVEWVWQTDKTGKITSAPQQVLELIAPGNEGETDTGILDLIERSIDSVGKDDLRKVQDAFKNNHEFHDVTLPVFSDAKQDLRWIMMRGRPQYENGKFAGFRGIFADATTAITAQKQVEFLAEHDPLTGTFNRNLIQTCLSELDANNDRATIYLIDLDGFKQVNDSYGHTIGDNLLQAVADRLRGIVEEKDIVARLGGDEFLIVSKSTDTPTNQPSDELSAQILTVLSENFYISQYDIALSASIGTAVFPDDTDNGPSLLNLADLALYAAKKGGRNKSTAFIQDMQVGLQNHLIVTERLRNAVKNDEIVPYYQAQYCAQSHVLVGFEALARWNDPELGAVSPEIFIPIAEETGLIQDLGERLLRTACKDALQWPSNVNGNQLTVSVNVSPVQVTSGNLLETVDSALKSTGLLPERLEIEVTESVMIGDMTGTCEVLRKLSALGVSIALDDFGTGYSSLSYIRALPLDRLKIDRSFIADIDDREARSIVQTIIELCQRLELIVIAEGVETLENVQTLQQMQCDILQGYYFSRPISFADSNQLIADQAVVEPQSQNLLSTSARS